MPTDPPADAPDHPEARPRDGARRRLLLGAAALGGTALLGTGCTSLELKQREWIFQPGQRSWRGGEAAAQGMAEIWIDHRSALTGQDVRLHGLWLPQAGDAAAPLLLYLHGARFDVRGSAPRMRRLHQLGYAVLAVDYRGFGQSTDVLPSQELVIEDARAAWDWLGRQHPGRPRHLFGHSLGGAVAVHVAADVGPALAGLIVEGSFTSIPDVVSHYAWGWLPLGPLITQRLAAGERIAEVRAPVLVVHGSADRVVDPAVGRALYERAPEPKRWLLVEGASHHNANALGLDQYREAVRALFGVQARAQG